MLDIVAEDRKELMISLIDRASFMQASIEELEEIMNEFGYTETYQNGANQSGKKKSSEAEVYLSMIQRYNQTISTMGSLLPDFEGKKRSEGNLFDFISEKPKLKVTR